MDTSDWIALGALVVSVLVAGGSLVGYLSNRSAAKDATEKAERATVAAERSAAAHERVARAAELQLISAARSGDTPRVAWQLTALSGEAYELENVGTAPAYDVQIAPAHPSLHVQAATQDDLHEVKPSDALKLYAFISLATSDDRIAVTWADQPGATERREWKRSLPPTP